MLLLHSFNVLCLLYQIDLSKGGIPDLKTLIANKIKRSLFFVTDKKQVHTYRISHTTATKKIEEHTCIVSVT